MNCNAMLSLCIDLYYVQIHIAYKGIVHTILRCVRQWFHIELYGGIKLKLKYNWILIVSKE